MYKPIEINYEWTSLEPHIGANTLWIHYNKYYLKYLGKLNEILAKYNFDFNTSKEYLLSHINEIPNEIKEKVLLYLGGILNHELYFMNLSDKKNNKFCDEFKNAINKNFNNYEEFKKIFISNANSVIGSGYTHLVINSRLEFEIVNTSNHVLPQSYGFIPIITMDVFEHSYFLDYQYRKDEYFEAFFEVIDYEKVNNIYVNIIKNKSYLS